MKMKNIIFLLFYGLILVFAGIVTYRLFDEIFVKGNNSIQVVSISAFLGAFFAFLFIRMSDFFLKISTRISKNYNSLVQIQLYSNENIDIISDNLNILNQIISQFDIIINKNEPIVVPINIVETIIEKQPYMSLTNLEMINQLFIYNSKLRKLNQSSRNFIRITESLNDSFKSKDITFETYKSNFLVIKNNAIDLNNNMNRCLDKSKEILSLVWVLSKNKPFISWVTQLISKDNFSEKQKTLITKKKEILNQEIIQNKK